jgi:GNAT superfamily N-acetyltransferase
MISHASLLIQILLASHLNTLIDTIAQLRIDTFKEYPYLYSGTLEGERDFLQTYNEHQHEMVGQATVDGTLAGILTGKPLSIFPEATDLFKKEGLNPEEYYYFGEIIILSDFKNKSVDTQLFNNLEQQVKQWGYTKACLMIATDQQNHSMRPASYEDYEASLCKRLGYVKTTITISLTWPP